KAEVWKNFKIKGINVGVEEYGAGEVEVFPNPTTGELRVTSYELQVTSIEVFDIYGRAVSTHYSLLTTYYSIDISLFPAGIYFVKITTDAGMVVKKVVKE
ncbi:MAG: T9SS type A sorting domain-containing protein, partial [Bacteroidales bacterium]|nr:T9SS type A sorting domain-containing protein [Bacteroidales bacterium]